MNIPKEDLIMILEGSCHCGAVRFSVTAPEPYPYLRCYCSICRKTAGGGGYAINLGARAETLRVQGRDHISIYRAHLPGQSEPSPGERNFCAHCGSALWVFDPRWPELVHPFASSIDTPLPRPPERVHIMLDYAAPWCDIPQGPREHRFAEYPDESLEAWHRRHGLFEG
jgi:hypothetical protein